MLVIRMQRTGRKGHAQFRVVVQDSRRTPTSGKIVANLGHYNPHSKELVVDKEKAAFYLEHGAQPSERAARLLKNNGVKLPAWVKLSADKERTVRNADKRRSTAPAPEVEEAAQEEVVEEAEQAEVAADAAAEATPEA
ncbi:30S ribosomal protein S16 [Candidatus Saccharibacteria bacterium]|jgi:small subunit ribosomal protein S16|nr:30S ribosomal protein S16 [Candidatus Saccharibacteria bacterium]